MKIHQKMKKLNLSPAFAIPFLLGALFSSLLACSSAPVVDVVPDSAGISVLRCPDDITQTNPVVLWMPPLATDSDRDGEIIMPGGVTITDADLDPVSSGDTFTLGSTALTVTFTTDTATDMSCTFTILIEERPDSRYALYLFDENAPATAGSAVNPFRIEASPDLITLASLVSDDEAYTPQGGTSSLYRAASYRLANDINLSPTTGHDHVPIGSTNSPFTGTFDGDGNTLSNLSYDGAYEALGLFSVISGSATISNLTLMDPAITNTLDNTGSLVGSSISLDLGSVIDDVHVIGGSIVGTSYVGGLVGYSAGKNIIKDSSVAAAVTGVTGTSSNVGGLVGSTSGLLDENTFSYTAYNTIIDSTATGTVSAPVDTVLINQSIGGLVGLATYTIITSSTATGAVTGTSYVGGLVGAQDDGTITASTASGAVSGGLLISSEVGGLVGFQGSNGTITASSATGAVTAAFSVGGLVGRQNDGTITASSASGAVTASFSVGGLVGSQTGTNSTITSSSASGSVTGSGSVTNSQFKSIGGLVGRQDDGTIISSYATGRVTGRASSNVGGLVGKQFSSGTITASSASGTVSGYSYVGGLVGAQDGTITASYASGAVSGSSRVGGLVGAQDGTITASSASGTVSGTSNVGGLVGAQDGTITASYATGAVMGTSLVGGLVGRQFSGGTITASYWDTQTTGQTSSAGGVGYTTAELQVLGGTGSIYETWTTPPWNFMAGAYPTLSPLSP